MDAVARRLKGVHPNAQKQLSKNPKYVSAGLQEYKIYYDGSLWRVKRHRGGSLPDKLKCGYTTINQCEAELIRYLRETDRFGKAIYPGATRSS